MVTVRVKKGEICGICSLTDFRVKSNLCSSHLKLCDGPSKNVQLTASHHDLTNQWVVPCSLAALTWLTHHFFSLLTLNWDTWDFHLKVGQTRGHFKHPFCLCITVSLFPPINRPGFTSADHLHLGVCSHLDPRIWFALPDNLPDSAPIIYSGLGPPWASSPLTARLTSKTNIGKTTKNEHFYLRLNKTAIESKLYFPHISAASLFCEHFQERRRETVCFSASIDWLPGLLIVCLAANRFTKMINALLWQVLLWHSLDDCKPVCVCVFVANPVPGGSLAAPSSQWKSLNSYSYINWTAVDLLLSRRAHAQLAVRFHLKLRNYDSLQWTSCFK